MIEQGYKKVKNLMTYGARFLVLRRGHVSHSENVLCFQKSLFSARTTNKWSNNDKGTTF